MRWDENAHMEEDPWCTWLHICGDILCNRKKRSLQRHHGERRIESIHTARKVRREEAAKKEDFFWRRRTSHLKPSNTSQRQVLLGEITWNLHLLISIWFYWFFENPGAILLIGVDGKGHKLFCWDWLLTCLPRICLWSFPLAWAHWEIMTCGFIWFLFCLFVLFLFSLFSTIIVFAPSS